MAGGAPWSVKGIDPKAREVAKDLARRSGMTLGEWLNHVILEDDLPEEITSEDHFTARGRPAVADQAGFYMSSSQLRQRPDWALHKTDDLSRIAAALGRLTDRIEASETRTGLAITSVEHSVREAMARIDTAERERLHAAARLDGESARTSEDQAMLAERMRRLEASGPRSSEALRLLEQSVANRMQAGEQDLRETIQGLEARMARAEQGADPAALIEQVAANLGGRLAEAEGRTTFALESLRGTLGELDKRIRATEGAARSEMDQRLAVLADQLQRQVDAARTEIAQRLAVAPTPKVAARLNAMEAELRQAEQRSAKAIQDMGREVLTLAESLSRRVQASEQRTASAIENVGGEMARIAGAMETRLNRVDEVHAQALERLGTEIGEITERLTDRIIQSERRAAQAIDDVGDQVSRVTERIEQRYERISNDLAERIRQSEERTARLLEDARASLDQRTAAAAQRAPAEPASPVAAVAEDWDAFDAPVDQAEQPIAPEPAAEFRIQPQAPVATPVKTAAAAAAPTPRMIHADPMSAVMPAAFGPELFSRAEPIIPPALDPARPDFGAEDFEAADGFAPISELDLEPEPVRTPEPEDDFFQPAPPRGMDAEAFPPPPLKPASEETLSTREVIDQARAAARAAKPPPAEDRNRPPSLGILQALRPGRPTSAWQTALLVAGGAAFLSVGAAGVVLMDSPGRDSRGGLPFEFAPRAAIALAPPSTSSLAPAPALIAPAAPAQAPAGTRDNADFVKVAAAIEKGEAGAFFKLREMAEAGMPSAQLYLASLYEKGEAGVRVNMPEARRWTERAALGGDAKAMHNLALYYFRGEGGERDTASAARWFKKAAERGVVDSQYNLGLLYQAGAGVERNIPEAYRWFSIAADGGDSTARASAVSLEGSMTPAQISAATRQASSFQPLIDRPVRAQAAEVGQPQLAAAQRILGKLGYYTGEADGASSQAFSTALLSYQRDQGLAATGSLDAATASRLAAFTR